MGIPRHGEARLWDDYLLPEHWCFHIYSYQAILELDGVPCQIRPGWASLVPPGTRMTYKYSGSSEHVYFHFKPIIGSHTYEVPMVFDLRERYQEFNSRARSAVELGGRLSGLASAHLWSLLWDSTIPEGDHSRSKSAYGHPAVEMATRHIEQRLGTRLSVAELCKEVGVSYGYLTRLFTAHVGVSVSDYVRKRRADEAEHLLRSTTLPIKVIARTVGLPDLQRFNRLMHTAKGMSP
ncbi:MAG TPA: AraC family transcriptional regulator [Fimbriimonas sp.]|nr:AraC family transcriptional regulator [Fimbriimonas sp.]